MPNNPATFLTAIVGTDNSPVPIDEVMATSSVDARGLDLFTILSPLADTIASITGIIVTRSDNRPAGIGDLIITPPNTITPWVSPNSASVIAMAVNWWQEVGSLVQISVDGGDVTYLLTITITTAAGRVLVFTASQLVSATTS